MPFHGASSYQSYVETQSGYKEWKEFKLCNVILLDKNLTTENEDFKYFCNIIQQGDHMRFLIREMEGFQYASSVLLVLLLLDESA